MFHKNLTRRGETLVEVLIALFVISVAGLAALSLLSTSRITNDNILTRTIALNLAREGVEAVRNVRDSNWQRYANEGIFMWDCEDTFDCPVENPPDSDKMWREGSYIIYFDDDFVWKMEREGGLNLQASDSFCEVGNTAGHCDYSLRKYTCAQDAVAGDSLYLDYGLYNHTAASFDAEDVLSCPVGVSVRAEGYGTDFFREVVLTESGESWKVDVSVKWIEDGEVKSSDLTTYLSNYIPEINQRSIDINN